MLLERNVSVVYVVQNLDEAWKCTLTKLSENIIMMDDKQ